jgi:hypothetical protein
MADLQDFNSISAGLPAAQLRQRYAADGFLLLSGLIDADISRTAAEVLVGLPGIDGRVEALRPPDQYVADRGLVEHYARQDQALLACFSDAFIDTTAMLVDNPIAHRPDGVQTQILLESSRPWSQPNPHIDGIPKDNRHKTFPGPYEIAFIIYLSDIQPQGGGTVGWPGSHQKVQKKALSDPERYQYVHDLNKEVPGLDLGQAVELLPRRGDILFFQHMWVHGSSFNIRPEPRLAIRPLCSCPACNSRWYKRDGWSFWQP